MKLPFTIFLFFSAHYGFSQTDSIMAILSKPDYKIQYPKNWRLDTSKLMGTDFIVFAPLENPSDKFSENVNGITQDMRGHNIDLEKYKEITDGQISQFVTDAEVFESEIIKTNERAYYRVAYAMTQGKTRLRITSVCFIKNEKAYLATFTTEFDKYEQYKKLGEEILSSFALSE